jgi:hypothetical protein
MGPRADTNFSDQRPAASAIKAERGRLCPSCGYSKIPRRVVIGSQEGNGMIRLREGFMGRKVKIRQFLEQ